MSMKSYEAVLVGIPEYRWVKRLMLYVPPVLLVLGTLGNAFSFLILRRRDMQKVSSYHYLACLALADSLVLYIGLFRLWLAEITGSDFHDSGDWVCKLTVSLGYAASDLSVWLIIAVTVERYIVVCFPLRASSMITTARAKKVIGFLMLLMLTLNLHFFWTVQIVDRPFDDRNVSNCEAAPFHEGLVNDVWPWLDACIYSFVPFIAILVLNIFIIIEVIEARNHRQRMQTRPDNAPSPSARGGSHYQDDHAAGDRRRLTRRSSRPGEGTKLTIMLLSVSFTFLLTTLPMNVSLIVTAFWQPQSTLRQVARFKLVRTVAELLMYVNHSINFFLYCATGHKFRQQIVHMLTCRTQSAPAPWSSMHTEDSKMLQASVRNGHHPWTSPHRRPLMSNVANDDEVYGLNGETIPLRAV